MATQSTTSPATRAPFPQPHKLSSGTTRWALRELLAWEGNATDSPQDSPQYLDAETVAQRYGVHVATVWRWTREGAK